MRPILTADEMRAADARAIASGIPGVTLMENAGVAVARAIEARWGRERRVAILCGAGNNGGDGFVIARVLKSDWTRVYVIGALDAIRGDARHHLDRLRRERARLSVTFVESEEARRGIATELARASVIVDALLGTGARGEPRGLHAGAIEAIRRERTRGARVVAVDLPSGVPANAEAFDWPAVSADLTITFAARKPCHVFAPAADLCGVTEVVPIGLKAEALSFDGRRPPLFEIEAADARAAFPRRPLDSHKGTFGHVLVVAGSSGKAGAALLAARGAFRAGAGLVTIASTTEVCRIATAAQPEVMTVALGEAAECGDIPRAVTKLADTLSGVDAVVLGPGLGRGEKTQDFALDVAARCGRPVVIDADGLFALRAQTMSRISQRDQPTVLTPHPGEMARLLGLETAAVQRDRAAAVARAASETRATVVLKGRHSLIGTPQPEIRVNLSGSPALATAGSGDVLAGMVGALLARGLSAEEAATAAVHVHGLAGERAGRRRPWGTLAGDVAEAVPRVIATLGRS